MRRVAIVFSIAVLATACRRAAKPDGPAEIAGLRTAAALEREIPSVVEVDGMVVGRQEAVLSSRLSASVLDVRAVPGERVRAGEVLVRLEQRESQGALEGARVGLDAARAAYEIARKNRDRYQGLADREAVAVIELDRTIREEALARAQVAAGEAALRRAEIDRNQAILTAPFDAVVVEKMVASGDLAVPGRPLVRLASAVGRRVEAAPAAEEAARLRPGEQLEILLGADVISGRVAEIVGSVDRETRRRIIRVDLPAGVDPPVGAFARVRLPGAVERRLSVPRRAVVARGGLNLAWAVGEDRRAALRYVRLGVDLENDRVEIRSGLSAGEQVVLDPPADLVSGVRVRS